MNLATAVVSSLVLAASVAACHGEDAPSDGAGPPTAPVATVRSLQRSHDVCGELSPGAAADALLVEGIEIEGGPVTFRWSTAADAQVRVTSWFSAAPLNALSDGLIAEYRGQRLPAGREIRPLARAWRDRAPLQGATLAPGRYWLLTRAQFPGTGLVGEISYGWDSEGSPGTLSHSWDVRPAGGCTTS